MSRHRFMVTFSVVDEVLADHDGEHAPPPNEVEEWNGRDIVQAYNDGIVDEVEVDYYVELVPEPVTAGGDFLFAFIVGAGAGAGVVLAWRGLLRWAVSMSRLD